MEWTTWLAFFVASWAISISPGIAPGHDARAGRRQMLARGWMINAVNPKGTVFLLAVLPQFLDLSATLWPQYLIMALTPGFTDSVVMSGYMAIAAGLLRTLESAAHVRLIDRVFGTLFIAAGALLSIFKRGA